MGTLSKIILIAGPTASGKSSFAVKLAKKINGEIINADSMQVYKELKILTARPNKKNQNNIKHHLYGIQSVKKNFSTGTWLKLVIKKIKEIQKKNKVPIIVGGTGLYFRALTEGLVKIPNIPLKIRKETRFLQATIGQKKFYQKLIKIDPIIKNKINSNDVQRSIRAFEIKKFTKKSMIKWFSKTKIFFDINSFLKIYIDFPRANLIEKIKQRTGMGQPVEPKFNFMGEAHKNPEGGVERVFNNMLSPVTVSKLEDSIIADEILRLGKAPANMKKYQENVDFSQYVNKQGVSAYYRLNYHLSTVTKGEPPLTLQQKLRQVILSDDYKFKSDPLKIGKGVADDGEKYREIERIYNEYKIDAKNALRKEWGAFTHKDDDRRTLSGDISKTNKNKLAIQQTNRTDQSLIESLVAVENF